MGFPGGTSDKEPPCQCRRQERCGFDPWVEKITCRRAWQPTPVFLPGEPHGQGSLAGYSPQGHRVRHDWATFSTTTMKGVNIQGLWGGCLHKGWPVGGKGAQGGFRDSNRKGSLVGCVRAGQIGRGGRCFEAAAWRGSPEPGRGEQGMHLEKMRKRSVL